MSDYSEQKLIESLYNVTLYPERHDELMHLWEAELIDNVEASLDDVDSYEINTKTAEEGHISNLLEQHCHRAFAILDMVKNQGNIPTLKQMVEADPLPTFIVSAHNKIVLANKAAKNRLAINALNQDISSIFSADNIVKITEITSRLDGYLSDVVVEIIQTDGRASDTPILLALSKIYDTNTHTNYLQLSTIHMSWEDKIGEIIQDTFQLTQSELDIAKRLISGQTLADIATDKDRSLLTIQTQRKSLFRKVKISSQGELIRLYVALLDFDHSEKSFAVDYLNRPTQAVAFEKQNNYLTRANGRKYYYEIHGDPDGEPIMFMHGMFSGTKFPQNILDLLIEKKLKFIVPHRAGYGHSDICEKKDKMATFVADISALLDELNIESCRFFGHQNGSYYSYWLASKIPERMKHITIVNGVVPFASSQYIHQMNARQRIISYTAKYTPKLLPFMFKSAISQIQNDGGITMIDAIYGNSPHDLKLCKAPETRDLILNGFQTCASQGVESLINDVSRVFGGNWENLVTDCTVPITLYHATEDPTVPIKQIVEFFENHEHVDVIVLPAGGYLFYTEPEKILSGF